MPGSCELFTVPDVVCVYCSGTRLVSTVCDDAKSVTISVPAPEMVESDIPFTDSTTDGNPSVFIETVESPLDNIVSPAAAISKSTSTTLMSRR